MTLARPESRNAFDAALIGELAEAFVDVGKARAVVLRGDGPSFCAGADVEWMRASADLDSRRTSPTRTRCGGCSRRSTAAPPPWSRPCTATRSAAASGSSPAATSCSPTQRTVFAFSEVKLGIVPAVISPFALRKIGESAARRYFVTGERFDAETALRIGLVHEVTDDLDAALEQHPRASCARQGRARRATRSGSCSTAPTDPETARRIAERRTSDEGQEGLRAFLERRAPSWAPEPDS